MDRWQQDELGQFAEERDITRSDVIRRAIADEIQEEKLPHHSCRHNAYGMGCEDFDQLHSRSGGACEICRMTPPKLYIDHDHSVGLHGVRGLVCPKCNALMRRVDANDVKPTEAVAAYIASAWHLTPNRVQPERKRTGRPRKRTGEKYATPQRQFRVPDDIWRAAMSAAETNGESVTDVVVAALERYGRPQRR